MSAGEFEHGLDGAPAASVTVFALLCLLPLAAAAPFYQADNEGRAHRHRIALENAAAEAAVDMEDMRCAGTGVVHRGCLFKDLYFDTQTSTFMFFGRVPGEAEVGTVADRQERFAAETCASTCIVVVSFCSC